MMEVKCTGWEEEMSGRICGDTKKQARMYPICLYRVPRDLYLKMVKSDSNTSLLDSDAHSVSVPWLYWLVVVVSKGDRLYWD